MLLPRSLSLRMCEDRAAAAVPVAKADIRQGRKGKQYCQNRVSADDWKFHCFSCLAEASNVLKGGCYVSRKSQLSDDFLHL